MNKKLIITNVIIILLSAVTFSFAQEKSTVANDKSSVTAVESVDLDKYKGRWFEIARYPNRFQKKCVGEVTATYVLKDEKTVEVVNECLKKNGKTIKAKGKARIVDEKSNAKLEVRFAPSWLSWLPQVWGDYWILDLDKDYKYAVVGDPSRDYLWILSREPKLDTKIYEGILDKVEGMGFNPNKLIKTPQNTEIIKGEVITKPQT
jgi:apolipoprotein D and lipocalin family protein